MLILIVFAFLAGLVTILSPCILPILPIILSGSVGGDKKRPLGIIIGFIGSFTFFTLFLTQLVQWTGISADSLRIVSVIVIGLMGLSFLMPRIQLIIEQAVGAIHELPLLNKLTAGTQGTNFWGGILVGLSLGLIWTPCVGPILASVISLALTGSVSSTAFFITLAYSLGTGIPMLAIMYGGRQLLQKSPWLLRNTGKIQKAFGVLMIITAMAIHFNWDRKFQTWVLTTFPSYGTGLTQFEDNQVIEDALKQVQDEPIPKEKMGQPKNEFMPDEQSYKQAPELIPGGEWLNSEPLTLAQLQQEGKVVLLDFWTFSCINCIRTLPYLKEWHQKYADQGLVIIGAHAPEFEFEKDLTNLKEAVADYELTYPIMQDNDFKTWRAYENHWWPAKFLIDKQGRTRYFHKGEGKYKETEAKIQELLKESGVTVDERLTDDPNQQFTPRTPELYLGYDRVEYFASNEAFVPDQLTTYSIPASFPEHHFALEGNWTITPEYAEAKPGAKLVLHFIGKEVYLVMQPMGTSRVNVQLDGQPIGEFGGEDVIDSHVSVDSDRLYRLVKLPKSEGHTLILEFPEGNVGLFAFTFG